MSAATSGATSDLMIFFFLQDSSFEVFISFQDSLTTHQEIKLFINNEASIFINISL